MLKHATRRLEAVDDCGGCERTSCFRFLGVRRFITSKFDEYARGGLTLHRFSSAFLGDGLNGRPS